MKKIVAVLLVLCLAVGGAFAVIQFSGELVTSIYSADSNGIRVGQWEDAQAGYRLKVSAVVGGANWASIFALQLGGNGDHAVSIPLDGTGGKNLNALGILLGRYGLFMNGGAFVFFYPAKWLSISVGAIPDDGSLKAWGTPGKFDTGYDHVAGLRLEFVNLVPGLNFGVAYDMPSTFEADEYWFNAVVAGAKYKGLGDKLTATLGYRIGYRDVLTYEGLAVSGLLPDLINDLGNTIFFGAKYALNETVTELSVDGAFGIYTDTNPFAKNPDAAFEKAVTDIGTAMSGGTTPSATDVALVNGYAEDWWTSTGGIVGHLNPTGATATGATVFKADVWERAGFALAGGNLGLSFAVGEFVESWTTIGADKNISGSTFTLKLAPEVSYKILDVLKVGLNSEFDLQFATVDGTARTKDDDGWNMFYFKVMPYIDLLPAGDAITFRVYDRVFIEKGDDKVKNGFGISATVKL